MEHFANTSRAIFDLLEIGDAKGVGPRFETFPWLHLDWIITFHHQLRLFFGITAIDLSKFEAGQDGGINDIRSPVSRSRDGLQWALSIGITRYLRECVLFLEDEDLLLGFDAFLKYIAKYLGVGARQGVGKQKLFGFEGFRLHDILEEAGEAAALIILGVE